MLKQLLALVLLPTLALAAPPHIIDNMPLVNQPIQAPRGGIAPIDNMPLVITHGIFANTEVPLAKRDPSVWYYLQSSVRVRNGNTVGSATICHYDPAENTAYLISCGHLFTGNKKPNEKPGTCFVEVFYKNFIKLDTPQKFLATIICYDNKEDISFLKFTPDWRVNHEFPIAPLDYPIKAGNVYESTGCDSAEEAASYTVQVTDPGGENIITQNNSPRPGRSGGALLSADGYYLGIVWGTSNYDGTGLGYCVPLKRIHAYAKQFKETDWLLEIAHVRNLVNTIPIIENGVKRYDHFLIPVP